MSNQQALDILEERIDYWQSNPHCSETEALKMMRELEIVADMLKQAAE